MADVRAGCQGEQPVRVRVRVRVGVGVGVGVRVRVRVHVAVQVPRCALEPCTNYQYLL